MTERDNSRPVGWILPISENNEGKAIAEAWVERNKQLLDLLTTTIAKDLEMSAGDSLMMMWVSLKGITDELHAILTHSQVEVVPDATRQ